ncbi:hypothetical protein G9A89_012840 [Geosiphon pyriformis]|nr:hypothetical protein G9A89_012840 [Geosiphon pyriformis]
MAASVNDFLAGYVSGVAGLLIGNPLDVLKVRLQTQKNPHNPNGSDIIVTPQLTGLRNLRRMVQVEGVKMVFDHLYIQMQFLIKNLIASPIIGLAFLNSILFVSYGNILRLLQGFEKPDSKKGNTLVPSMLNVYWAGFGAGLACFFVSTPTELIKCKTQVIIPLPMSSQNQNRDANSSNDFSWNIFKDVLRRQGIRGLYHGGCITIMRDTISYGVYFWAYEGLKRILGETSDSSNTSMVLKTLFAGGMAGVLSWVSIYPLDVIKTRIQTESISTSSTNFVETHRSIRTSVNYSSSFDSHHVHSLSDDTRPYSGILDCALRSYRAEGITVFCKGIGPTVLRALPVSAVTFYVYEIMMNWLKSDHGIVP